MNGTFPSSTPILLGHEAAGFVEAVGANVTSVRPGDRVVTCLSIFCGQSRYCLSGRLTLCANRSATVLKDPAVCVITQVGPFDPRPASAPSPRRLACMEWT